MTKNYVLPMTTASTSPPAEEVTPSSFLLRITSSSASPPPPLLGGYCHGPPPSSCWCCHLSSRHPISLHSHVPNSIPPVCHHLLIVGCPLSVPLWSSFFALVAAADLVVLVAAFVPAREEAYCLPGGYYPPFVLIKAPCLWAKERQYRPSPSLSSMLS